MNNSYWKQTVKFLLDLILSSSRITKRINKNILIFNYKLYIVSCYFLIKMYFNMSKRKTTLDGFVVPSPSTKTLKLEVTTPSTSATQPQIQKIHPLITKDNVNELFNQNGYTLLSLASANGDIGLIQKLLALGANPNLATKKSIYGKSTFPLHLAALNGKAAATALLIASGADVNLKDTTYKTASYYARYAGHHMVAEIIETPRILVEACDDEGNFPIHLVAENGTMQDMCKSIVSGASHTITNQRGQTALHIIASCREGDSESIEMMKLLLAKCPDNASLKAYLETKDHQGDTALHVAAFYGPQYLSLLISAGANENAENNIGETPLHIATAGPCQSLSEEDDLSRISYLIKAGANINAKNANGDTPLHIVNSDGDETDHGIDVLRLLLAARADINLQNDNGNTLLHTEAYRNKVEQVAFLIKNNALLNIQNEESLTPLHIAVMEESLDVISELLRAGADHNILDTNGHTPLDIAIDEGGEDIQRIFKDFGVVASNPNAVVDNEASVLGNDLDSID